MNKANIHKRAHSLVQYLAGDELDSFSTISNTMWEVTLKKTYLRKDRPAIFTLSYSPHAKFKGSYGGKEYPLNTEEEKVAFGDVVRGRKE